MTKRLMILFAITELMKVPVNYTSMLLSVDRTFYVSFHNLFKLYAEIMNIEQLT